MGQEARCVTFFTESKIIVFKPISKRFHTEATLKHSVVTPRPAERGSFKEDGSKTASLC
jgi:hypothetical protein